MNWYEWFLGGPPWLVTVKMVSVGAALLVSAYILTELWLNWTHKPDSTDDLLSELFEEENL